MDISRQRRTSWPERDRPVLRDRAITADALLALLYAVLCLSPLALAALAGGTGPGFWLRLSSAVALVGFAMLAVQFALSGRFRVVTETIGIDLLMRFHQAMGRMLVAFVLLHPVLYLVPSLWASHAQSLALVRSLALSAGIRTGFVAWLLVALLASLAVWRRSLPITYETWRVVHAGGAAAILALSLHHLLRVGVYSANPLLRGFWIVLVALAFLSMAHIFVVIPLMQRRSGYRVASNRKVGDHTWELTLEPEAGKAVDFVPGQFVWLKVADTPFGLSEHPFSISSAPVQRPQLAFTIKESGDFTGKIGELNPGARVYLAGPHGNFTADRGKPGPITFVAGGVGIAPIVSMLRQLAADRYPQPVSLIYGNRLQEQILYRDELDRMKDILDLTVHFVLSKPPPCWRGAVGDLTPEVLKSCLEKSAAAAHYFVCGPPAMMDSVARTLRDLGVPRGRIISERFDLAEGKGLTQTLRARALHISLATVFAGAAVVFAVIVGAPIGHGSGHGFLIDKHLEAGLICESCHSRASSSAAPDMALCTSCHGSYSQIAAQTASDRPNPHASHLGKVPCASCHRVHEASRMSCNECHTFAKRPP